MAKISLALSGSGFKFPVHVGALKAVLDSRHELVEVSGTSGGSIVAGMWACDMPEGRMMDIALCTDWRPFVKFQPLSFLRGGLNDGKKVLDFCREITKGLTFESSERPISIVSTDLVTSGPYLFSQTETPSTPIAEAIRASISIPLLFTPYKLGDKLLVDGVVSNSLPMNHLFKEDSIRVGVKIDNTGPTYPYISMKSGPFDIARRALYHLVDKQDVWTLDSGLFGNLVKVNTDYTPGLHPNHPREVREKLMEDGYTSMKSFLDTLPI